MSTGHDVVARYFEMWNTGDSSVAPEVLGPGWVDHAHPEINSVGEVQKAVERLHAARPGLRFEIETFLGDADLVAAVGAVHHPPELGREADRLIWLVRLDGGRMAEMWTYRHNGP